MIGVKLDDAAEYTYRFDPMETLLYQWEKMKKDKHGKHYHEQPTYFSLFFLSVDGILGSEALDILANLS